MLLLTFSLLALSVCCVWIDKISIGSSHKVVPWILCFILSILCGLVAGVLNSQAVIALLVLLVMAWLSNRQTISVFKYTLMIGSVTIALAMALHKIPGFSNPVIVNAVHISKEAIPYTLYANFDKGAAGLILFAFFCSRLNAIKGIKPLFKPIIIASSCTSIIVFGVALAIKYIQPDFKISAFTLPFLIINLFFVCVAEEAFFRGVIQEKLMHLLGSQMSAKGIAIIVSSILFGLAHFAGGATLAMLSMLAGIGYSIIYAHTRKIESSIMTHFVVNAVHFILFTYPSIGR